jgi:hypothetical protein
MTLEMTFKRCGLIVLAAIASLLLVACPPRPPCDERLTAEAQQSYQYNVLSNSLIEEISRELHLLHVFVGECIVAGKATIAMRYALPARYSRYGFTYSDVLRASYSVKDGSIELSNDAIQESLTNHEAVSSLFRDMIEDVESNPRIAEFLSKIDVDTSKSPIRLDSGEIRGVDGPSSIQYTPSSNTVRGYVLPNSIEWNEFPEIEEAHEIVQSNLLVGDLSTCSIDRRDYRGVTSVQFHDSENSPWYMSVAIQCGGVLKSAWLQLNADGSFERLELRQP